MKRLSQVLLIALVLAPLSAYAGGSWVPVKVESLEVKGETSYKLIVVPLDKNNHDPFLNGCERFVVHGDYKLPGASTRRYLPDRTRHLDALKRLEKAQKSGGLINFGWLGQGFRQRDRSNPCDVESRALSFELGGFGDEAIVSFFDPP